MPTFINQPLAQAVRRKDLDFSGLGRVIDEYKKNQDNLAIANSLRQSNGNPLDTAATAIERGNQGLGNLLMNQKFSQERFNQQQSAIDKRHGQSLDLQKQRLKALRSPDPANQLRLRKLELEINKLENPEHTNLGGFKSKKEKLGSESNFRKEFTKISGNFRSVRDAQSRIEASAKDPSAAGDLSMIFNYMKVLDPGSTVREGEFATAQNSAGVTAAIRARWNSLLNGERLAPEQRLDFLNRSRALYGKQEGQYLKTREIFKGIAKRGGLDEKSVLPDFTPPSQAIQPEIDQHIRTAINPQTGERIFIDTRTNTRVNR